MKGQNPIIVKKVKKTINSHHGGSWKVAYADFITAMMAFFLLLWLISMVSPEKRARVAAYFKHFSIFEESGTSFMERQSGVFDERGKSAQKAPEEYIGDNPNPEEIKEALKKSIEDKLGDVKEQVLVDIVEGGVRIQMIDKDGNLMFNLGSAVLTPSAKEILKVIGEQIKNMPNKITIEGHTDALTYARNDYSNWELSTERASSARKELETNGLNPNRIARVAGYADTDPLIKEDPYDPRNRRISIIINTTKKENKKEKFFGIYQ